MSRGRGAALALAATVTLAPAAVAQASGPGTGHQPGRSSESGGGSVDVGGCHLVAGPRSLGGHCSSVTRRLTKKDIDDLLAGDELVLRWCVRMTPEQQESTNAGPLPQPDLVWAYCYELHGIDPETHDVIGPITVSVWIETVTEDQLLKQPGAGQRSFIDAYANRASIPEPNLFTSPSPVPVVNQPVSFYNGPSSDVSVDVGALEVRARMVAMTITWAGGGAASCRFGAPGSFPLQVGDGTDPRESARTCLATFTRSSALEPDGTFALGVETSWVGEYRRGGGTWTQFSTFTKPGTGHIQVNEIQSVVVP